MNYLVNSKDIMIKKTNHDKKKQTQTHQIHHCFQKNEIKQKRTSIALNPKSSCEKKKKTQDPNNQLKVVVIQKYL